MSDGLPQFSTAEYLPSGQWICAACRKPNAGACYRINGRTVCEGCTHALQRQLPQDSPAAFARALSFGVGAALLGLILYATLAVATGLVIGFVSLAVGFLVGKALLYGSGGVRGRRYQVAAVILTYFAVSLSAVPIAIAQRRVHRPPAAVVASAPDPRLEVGRAAGLLVVAGLASPFLDLRDPVHGSIGLVILFVGLRIAWRLLRAPALSIEGPLTAAPLAPDTL